MTFGDEGKSTQITFIRKQYYIVNNWHWVLIALVKCRGGWVSGRAAAKKIPNFGTLPPTPLVIWTRMTRPWALGRTRA